MTPERLRLEEARRWLAQAAKDLNAAGLLATPEPSCSAFHSQQAAEKTAKGFLSFHNVPFRKTHSLGELGNQCVALDPSLAGIVAESKDLTDYAVVFRYLEAPHEPDEAEAIQALDIATRLYYEVRRLLRLEEEP